MLSCDESPIDKDLINRSLCMMFLSSAEFLFVLKINFDNTRPLKGHAKMGN